MKGKVSDMELENGICHSHAGRSEVKIPEQQQIIPKSITHTQNCNLKLALLSTRI